MHNLCNSIEIYSLGVIYGFLLPRHIERFDNRSLWLINGRIFFFFNILIIILKKNYFIIFNMQLSKTDIQHKCDCYELIQIYSQILSNYLLIVQKKNEITKYLIKMTVLSNTRSQTQ